MQRVRWLFHSQRTGEDHPYVGANEAKLPCGLPAKHLFEQRSRIHRVCLLGQKCAGGRDQSDHHAALRAGRERVPENHDAQTGVFDTRDCHSEGLVGLSRPADLQPGALGQREEERAERQIRGFIASHQKHEFGHQAVMFDVHRGQLQSDIKHFGP